MLGSPFYITDHLLFNAQNVFLKVGLKSIRLVQGALFKSFSFVKRYPREVSLEEATRHLLL